MRDYQGRLAPFKPLIAGLLLAGQRPIQIGRLLHELGAKATPYDHEPRTKTVDYSVNANAGLVSMLKKKWATGAAPSHYSPRPIVDDPKNRNLIEWETKSVASEAALSCRPMNVLLSNGYLTFGQVIRATDAELLRLPNLGMLSLAEIRHEIGSLPGITSVRGARLWMEPPKVAEIAQHEDYFRRIVREELERYFGPKP
jgi:hypothetical protein